MMRMIGVAMLVALPASAVADDRKCAMDVSRTGYTLKADLEMTSPQAADDDWGRMLAFGCRQQANGYMVAAIDMGAAGRNFSIPAAATNGQAQQIVLKWLADHPEKQHLSAWQCVIAALKDAFPNN